MEKDVSESILKNRSRREYEYRRKNVYYRRLRAIKKIASYIILTAVAVYAAFPPIYYAVETSLNRIGALVQSSISDLVPVHPPHYRTTTSCSSRNLSSCGSRTPWYSTLLQPP